MKKKGKRGCASFKKKLDEKDRYIHFDSNNKPVGVTCKWFMSWFGLKLKERFPIHIETGKLPKHLFDDLWLETKAFWNIETDAPKDFMMKKAVKTSTNFKSRLVTDFVNKGKNACNKYPFLDPEQWDEFVRQKSSDEFKAKSEKAKASAAKHTCPTRVGRGGWTGMEAKADIIWPLLEASYPFLKNLVNHRSKMYIMGRARKDKETNSYELSPDTIVISKNLVRVEREMIADGSYFVVKDDPLVRVLGPEHGGRTRGVSDVIGATRVHGGLYKRGRKRVRHELGVDVNRDRGSVPLVSASPPSDGSSCGSGGRLIDYPPVELANKETPSESTSALTRGSPSHRDASPQIHVDDAATNSCHLPQLEVVVPLQQIQPQEDVMQPQDIQGSFMNVQINEEEDGKSQQKRKRGRPRKLVDLQQTSEAQDDKSHQTRKRGRPSKLVANKPIGLLEGSSCFSSSDLQDNSMRQAIVTGAQTATNYQQDWPFIKQSPIWASIESLELYRTWPQKPHFSPLKKMEESWREGLAIAHMVTFGNLVQSLSNLKPNDPVNIINKSLETIAELETHGFDVGSVRARLNELLSLKTKVDQHEDKLKEDEKEVEKCNYEKSHGEKEKDQLKVKMQELKEKMVEIESMQKVKEGESTRLQSNMHLVSNQIKDLNNAFVKLAATPL